MSKRGSGEVPRRTLYRLKARAYACEREISASSSDSENEAPRRVIVPQQCAAEGDQQMQSAGEDIEPGGTSASDEDSSGSEENDDNRSHEEIVDDNASDGDNEHNNSFERDEAEEGYGHGQEHGEPDNNPRFEDNEEADNFLQQAAVHDDSSEGSDPESNSSSSSSSGSRTGDSTSESEEEGEPERIEGDARLYPNARLSVLESVMLVLSLALRFSLTGECITHLLETIELHCPTPNQCITTLYRFKTFFKEIGRETLVLHYFCESCYSELAGKDSVCANCEITEVAFFIEIPLVRQLQRLLMRPGFVDKLMYRFRREKKHEHNIEDIYDGNLYKEQMANNGILSGRHNISLTWYSDGIQIFKSVKYAVWPLFFVINELSYKERTLKENVILSGLWFGKTKPKPNLFLKPFRETFATFKNEGFNFNVPEGPPINVRGILICGTCDLQAKGIFLRTKLYNGYFGCNRCHSPGIRVPAGRTTVHAHRHVAPEDIQHRNIGEVVNAVRIAHQTGRPYLGYKGLSLLYFMMVDMLRGTSIDIMHLLFLGICKLLNRLWFDVQFQGEPYSCYQLIVVVNAKLAKIRPPSFVQRSTRTLDDLKLWKAKDYKLWFFYYSLVVMDGILDRVFLNHHMKLVSAISLLCQESIFPEQLNRAEVMLNEYVRDFHRLYGVRYMGMNVHLLLHLVDCVRDLGPLWVYSCFFFEDLNGQLVKLIHSPHQPGIQICSSASTFMSFKVLLERLNPDSLAKMFCLKLQESTCKLKTIEEINAKMLIVGHNTVKLNVPNDVINMIREQNGINHGHYQSFSKLRKNGVVHCCVLSRKKRCSHFACFDVNGTPTLAKIKHFIRWSDCNCIDVICQCQPARYFCIVQVYERVIWHGHNVPNVSIFHLSAVAPTETELVLQCEQIQSVCFYIELADNVMFLGTPVNKLEYE
ncbi:Halomucin [Frankliniella fusca]|uniref:Halomucin n=1 Tax=Frankliniella fusca TaxID=407009 RepID=A0AAE1LHS4_9NEOP|nr:Halomucin [Frankliniella fusca]